MKRCFAAFLIGGWGIYFAAVALVLVFPRQLVRHSSPAALLTLSLLLKAVVGDERIGFRGGTGRDSRRQLKENDPEALGEDAS